jgi:mannosylglucosylglycerate synthase
VKTVAFVSFRLGGTDGVSMSAQRWALAFMRHGYNVLTVAGEGPVDRCIPGLAIDASEPPTTREVVAAVDDADLVVVENLCTIPLNLAAARVVAQALAARPVVLHHHDPAWQRRRFAHVRELPPDDAAWRHVTINRLTERQFRERGLKATTIYNGFDVDGPVGNRERMRASLNIDVGELLLLHPVRAIERKAVPVALALAESIGATYWLTGPAEEGYGPTLRKLLAGARTRVLHQSVAVAAMPDAYAACDAVLFPSTWEGFGNPPIEAGIYRRPVVVGRYQVAAELRPLGFAWLSSDDPDGLRKATTAPDSAALANNRRLVERWFSQEALDSAIGRLLLANRWEA